MTLDAYSIVAVICLITFFRGCMNNLNIRILVKLWGLMMSLLSTAAWCGQYSAGFAKLDITPDIGAPMYTLEAGTKQVTAVHDQLFVRVLVLSDGKHRLAMLVIDSLYLPQSLIDSLSNKLGAEHGFDHVIVSSTHTHSGFFTVEALSALDTSIINTVTEASESMQAVEIGGARTRVDLSYNRIIRKQPQVEMLWTNPQRIPNRAVDNGVGVIHIRTLDNTPLVSLVNYNAHPVVTMDLTNVVVSADYPAHLGKKIEQELGGGTLFVLGAAGDINPYDANTSPTEEAIQKSREMGIELAEAVLESIHGIPNYSQQGQFAFASKTFSSPEAIVGAVLLTPEIGLAHFPGEYFDDFGLQLKQQSKLKYTFFLSMSNGELGYVPTAEAVSFGGYGADIDALKVQEDTGAKHVGYAISTLNDLGEASN